MSLMYAEMGMKVFGGLMQNSIDKTKASMSQATQDYQNAMSAISASYAMNDITLDGIAVRDAGQRVSASIELQAMQDRANVEVNAAAAGVRGGSVKSAMRGVTRSRLQAKYAQKERMMAAQRSSTNQRKNVLLDRAFNKDISVIPRPSTASALLGLGTSLIDVYDTYQPEGQKTTDAMGKYLER